VGKRKKIKSHRVVIFFEVEKEGAGSGSMASWLIRVEKEKMPG